MTRWIPACAHLFAIVALTLTSVVVGAGISPCDLDHPSDASVEWTCHTLGHDETLESLFGPRWIDVARFNRIDRRHAMPGTRIKVPRRLEDIECFSPMPQRFAPAAADSQSVLVDLAEQFLGAYEHGRLVFSAPVAVGRADDPTPRGVFRITAYDRQHHSSVYRIANTSRPYPMHFGLRFHVNARGMSYWIHGRDLPGIPASHGCVGLYDEAMQKQCYGQPGEPALTDARWLFEWAVGPGADTTGVHALESGPRLWIIGSPPAPRDTTTSGWQSDCIAPPWPEGHRAGSAKPPGSGGGKAMNVVRDFRNGQAGFMRAPAASSRRPAARLTGGHAPDTLAAARAPPAPRGT